MRTATDSCHGTRNQTWNLFTNLYSNSNLDSVSRADTSFAWECIRKWHTEPRCRCWCTAQMDELPCSLLFASLSVVLPAPCRKFVCAQCKFIFSFFCGSAAHCSALALLYLMSRTHTQSHTHTPVWGATVTETGASLCQKCLKNVLPVAVFRWQQNRTNINKVSTVARGKGRGPRGLHEEFLANTWHVAEIVAEGIVCAPGTLPFCSAPLRQRKLSVCSAKCCDLCAASRFLVQSNVHYFVHTDTVYICFEYHSTTPPPPSLSYSLLASFLPSVSECGCDPGAKCKMRLMQQFLLQNRISSGNVVQQCINWWQEIIES